MKLGTIMQILLGLCFVMFVTNIFIYMDKDNSGAVSGYVNALMWLFNFSIVFYSNGWHRK